MLAGDFFNITAMQSDNGKLDAVLEINAAHKIFKGHFPGQPVVPGVCMMQMVKEVLEKALGREIRLSTADHLKFLTIINPAENNIVQAALQYFIADDGRINMSASILNGPVIYFKMRGFFEFALEG